MSSAVNLSRAWQLSSHIHNMCSEAHEAIYTRESDVKYWLQKGNQICHLSIYLILLCLCISDNIIYVVYMSSYLRSDLGL